MSGLRRALAFLTPIGGAADPTPATVAWFPVAGALIGAAVGALWWLAAQAWPAPVMAAIVVAADLGLTGMLHFDGLLDSADGLLPHLSRERRLAVMAAPGIGAFAVAVGGAVLLVRFASVAAIPPRGVFFLVAGLWCAARTLMAGAMTSVPYARGEDGGLATSFLGRRGAGVVVAGGAAALLLAAQWRVVAGPVAVLVGLAAGAGVILLGRRQLGGFTGDVLGAAGVVAETVGLLVAAAKW
ncbi:MAG TPA: adenosylcobinamide-GDP ribazoletransferase [Acidimicrobiales bacterium]|nr:adenosylcobinamide-GDP ribazoletransferase [Acidimicrobiales bacterium]